MLTKKMIEGLKGKAERYYVYDEKAPSLAVCVMPSGRKTFYRCGKVNAKAKRERMGRFDIDITLDVARQQAAAMTMRLHAGLPATEVKRVAGKKLKEVWTYFFETHSKPHKRSWKKDEKEWRLYLSPWAERILETFTKPEVTLFHVNLAERIGKPTADDAVLMLKKLFKVAIENKWATESPCRGIKLFGEVERERFLSAAELPVFFAALDSLRSQTAKDFFTLALYTGARRANVASMRWDEIAFDADLWVIPKEKYKGKRVNTVVLVEPALEILRRRLADNLTNSPWVFPSTLSEAGHYMWPQKAWKRLLQNSELTNLTIHDLRRTLGSWQAAGGASMQIIGKSLGQNSSRSTRIYARLDLAPVRKSVDGAVAAIQAAAKEKPKNS